MSAAYDNWMIKASAGSGKTYRLVSRYIELMHRHGEPGRIMALTFTRKAAGEFMEKIIERLVEAASDPDKAREANVTCGMPGCGVADYEALLRLFIRQIGKVNLGTIDSFFSLLVRAFPYELGLSTPPRIMESHEESLAQRAAMGRLFYADDEASALQLLEIYKQFTFGSESKSILATFEGQINDCHLLYWEDRDVSLWGELARIFGPSPSWMEAPDSIEKAANRALELIADDSSLAKMTDSLEPLLESLLRWRPGESFNGKTLFPRLMNVYSQLAEGHAEVSFNRNTYVLQDELARCLHDIVGYYMKNEYKVRSVRTRYLAELMRRFEREYSLRLRETGGLVFADLPRLLVDHLRGEISVLGASQLLYRLDTRIDHWLLDEFQDTSRLQWQVLHEFIDEVLQSGGSERSLFYVGDVKQSIYGWRGGDSRLFDEIRTRYGEAIQSDPLKTSYRSCSTVISYINRIFGAISGIGALSDDVRSRWAANWEDHEVAFHLQGHEGFAGLFEVQEDADLEGGCVELLRTLDPIGRGLTCAVLLRNNKQVGDMTAALRVAGIPATMEGETSIATDNAAGVWLLSILGQLARPHEPLPAGIGASLSLPGLSSKKAATLDAVRDALGRGRFARAARWALQAAVQAGLEGPFIERRVAQLIDAARKYEQGDAQSLDGFIHFLLNSKARESSNRGAVQVMTVHKAKGLDFDAVVVAGFGTNALSRNDFSGLREKRDAAGRVEWVLDLPPKMLSEYEPVLNPLLKEGNNAAVFEALCLFYVALTRAKRGLYCVYKPEKQNSSRVTWMNLFDAASVFKPLPDDPTLPAFETLQVQQALGSFPWMDAFPSEPGEARIQPVPQTLLTPLPPQAIELRPVLRRRPSPSGVAHARQGRGPNIPSSAGKRFGSRVHLHLARYASIDTTDATAVQAVLETAPADIRPRLETFLRGPLAAEVFARPAADEEIWRERPYAFKRDGCVTNGIMDRVRIRRRPDGRALSAVIYDFKTDALDPARPAEEQLREKYAVQLDLYREALCRLEGLEREAVTGRLVPV